MDFEIGMLLHSNKEDLKGELAEERKDYNQARNLYFLMEDNLKKQTLMEGPASQINLRNAAS